MSKIELHQFFFSIKYLMNIAMSLNKETETYIVMYL